MNKLKRLILDNINKQKREGAYITPKREYKSESDKKDSKDNS